MPDNQEQRHWWNPLTWRPWVFAGCYFALIPASACVFWLMPDQFANTVTDFDPKLNVQELTIRREVHRKITRCITEPLWKAIAVRAGMRGITVSDSIEGVGDNWVPRTRVGRIVRHDHDKEASAGPQVTFVGVDWFELEPYKNGEAASAWLEAQLSIPVSYGALYCPDCSYDNWIRVNVDTVICRGAPAIAQCMDSLITASLGYGRSTRITKYKEIVPDSLLKAHLGEYLMTSTGYMQKTWPDYLRFVYLSAVTITTTGYGDILPVGDKGRLAAACESILGIVVIGLFINSLTSGRSATRNPPPGPSPFARSTETSPGDAS